MSCLLTSLTGDSVNITVGENTNLKGSLIAAGNTDENGVFQDNKNLNLSTKTLTFENSTNTKSSNTSGFGIGAGVNPQGDISSVSTQLSTGTTYERTKTLATLGQGNVNITDQTNSDDLTRLNTDTTQVDKSLFKTDTGTSVSATLDTRLLTAEGRAKIAEDAKKAKEHAEDIASGIATVATNDKIDITNLLDTVRDNTSATKLKDYLTQTAQGQQILAGLQADPTSQEYHDAQIAANQKLQEFRGLEVEKVVYYDAKATTNEKLKDTTSYDAQNDTLTQKDNQGVTITKGDATGTILLDVSGDAQNLSSKQNDTIASGHEVGEEKYLQNGYGTFFTDSYDTKVAMNDTYGAYYAQRLNEATNGGISDVPYATNTNTPSITSGTNIANGIAIPNNGVEYRQLSMEEKGLNNTYEAKLLKQVLAEKYPNIGKENIDKIFEQTQKGMVNAMDEYVLNLQVNTKGNQANKDDIKFIAQEAKDYFTEAAQGNVYLDRTTQNLVPMMDKNNFKDSTYDPSSNSKIITDTTVSIGLTGLGFATPVIGIPSWTIDTVRNWGASSVDDPKGMAQNMIPSIVGQPFFPNFSAPKTGAAMSIFNTGQSIDSYQKKIADLENQRDKNNKVKQIYSTPIQKKNVQIINKNNFLTIPNN